MVKSCLVLHGYLVRGANFLLVYSQVLIRFLYHVLIHWANELTAQTMLVNRSDARYAYK